MAVIKKKTRKQSDTMQIPIVKKITELFDGEIVKSQKVTKDPKASGSSDGAGQNQLRQGRVTAQKLNLRREPSTDSPKVDVLKQGTVVDILGEMGHWLQIEYEGRKGYAFGRYITPIETTETPPSEIADYKQQFLDLLNNKPDPSTSEKPREKGFVALVSGTTDLTEFEELCFSPQQTWNRCITVRYQYPVSRETFSEAISQLKTDVTSLANITKATALGAFRDEGSFTWNEWAKRLSEHASGKGWEKLILPRGFKSTLITGERLVIFLELSEASRVSKVEDVGFDINSEHELRKLSPRVGIVISGVSENITFPKTGGPHFERISVPTETKLELSYGQAFANDGTAGPDRLNIEAEVYALAETISLKEMKPPLVVGILGGWGWGKSFVLKLLEERIAKIRCHDLTSYKDNLDKFPYVGHPYVIRFDAWTYAKSSLWASLMQTILLELNRQIGLEQTLSKIKGVSQLNGSNIWQLLSDLDDRQRKILGESDLGKKALQQAAKFDHGEVSGEVLWKRFEQLKKRERQKLLEAEQGLASTRNKLESAKAKLEAQVDDKLKRRAKWAAWEPVLNELIRIGYSQNKNGKKSEKKDPPTFQEVLKDFSFFRKLWLGMGAAPLAFAVLVLLGALAAVKMEWVKDWIGWLGSGIGMVVGLANNIRRSHSWFDEKSREYQSGVDKASERLQQQREQLMRELVSEQDKSYREEQRRGATTTLEPNTISELEENIRELEAKVEDHRRNVGITAGYGSLLDFVKGRLDSGYYDEKLGLLHQVQKDLNELTEALLQSEGASRLFPRSAPRIILVIDDLDRCPPERVVEVLEAAQLLVKTELFVLVLAMDIRYITRALEKTYKDVLIRNGDPSGLDYIEKIVQVPYRVRPIQSSAMANFLGDQMSFEKSQTDKKKEHVEGEIEVEAKTEEKNDEPEGKKKKDRLGDEEKKTTGDLESRESKRQEPDLPMTIRKFEPDELKLLEACCNAVVMSPRAAKRIVNVFKLLKIIWERRGLESGPKKAVKQAMLLMLALAARHPDVMRGLLRDLEEKFRKEKNPGGTLKTFLTKRCEIAVRNALWPLNWQRVIGLLNDKKLLSTTLKLADVGADNIMLVSSFSFVGEGKTDPGQRKAADNKAMPSNGPT